MAMMEDHLRDWTLIATRASKDEELNIPVELRANAGCYTVSCGEHRNQDGACPFGRNSSDSCTCEGNVYKKLDIEDRAWFVKKNEDGIVVFATLQEVLIQKGMASPDGKNPAQPVVLEADLAKICKDLNCLQHLCPLRANNSCHNDTKYWKVKYRLTDNRIGSVTFHKK